ncbi:beta-ketoacyl-[acyl-carrier-protein] synthase family protein [Candidatus Omnitrophota bacterium]
MSVKRRVVVTGLGPVSPLGFGKDIFWDSILKQRVVLEKEKFSIKKEVWDSFLLHKVVDFNFDKFFPDERIIEDIKSWKGHREDRLLLYLLASIKLALDDSKLSLINADSDDVGIFLTAEHPGFESFCQGLLEETLEFLEKQIASKKDFSKKDTFSHLYEKFVQHGYDLQTFMYLFLIAKAFGIHGYSLFTNNACASGLFAMDAAVNQIKYGKSKIAIVAGGDFSCTMFKHLWFKTRGMYAEDGKIKPFSKKANGIALGDGAYAMVFEELEHALSRKAKIYAEYLSGGFSLEGWKVTLPLPGSLSYQKAIKQALDSSDLRPKDISLINPHGVGIKVTDAYEAKAITEIFGKKPKNLVSAFKPFIGHNLGGSAIAETIITLLSMQKGIVPPTLNCDDVEDKYHIALVKALIKKQLNIVMKLSCGFAGYNGSVIFKKYD